MVKINGFKVVGPTEVITGKAVEFCESNAGAKFRLTDYYINEYDTYLNRTLAEFSVEFKNCDNPKAKLNAFKNVLGKYVRIKEVYIEESVMDFLMS